MKLLLDTPVLLWAAGEPDKLSQEALRLIEAPDTELVFSAASPWEIAIKSSLGRSDLAVDARVLRRGLLDNGYHELPVDSAHAVAIIGLPAIHKDSFDRLLIAQALVEGITLLTADAIVAQYAGPISKIYPPHRGPMAPRRISQTDV